MWGKASTFVTKLFRQTNSKIFYRTDNTIKHILKIKDQNFNKYLASNVHKFYCLDCGKAYIGQIGKILKPKDQNFNKCLASRVHKLSCPDCGNAYILVGQTGKILKRYKEHHLSFRNNNTS